MDYYTGRDSQLVDVAAKKYQRENGGDYLSAVKAVLRAAKNEREERRSKARDNVRGDEPRWHIYQDSAGNTQAEMIGPGTRSLTELSNLVAGLPRKPDNQINANLAVQTINGNFCELGRNAAGDFLAAIAMKAMRKRNVTQGEVSTNDPFAAAFQTELAVARQQYPSVSQVYDGAAMTQEALRAILWPLFKDAPGPRYSRETGVRRYSSEPHIFHDSNGNEFHRY